VTLHAEDLPAATRKQLGIELQTKTGQVKRRRTTRDGMTVACDARCQCGERFTSSTAWERHSDEQGSGHRRLIVVGA
jgi:hypothetical protein